jgi:Flp pilus assembly protein TadG
MSRRKFHAYRRGVATVELAIAMPILMYMMLGVWEVGRLLDVQVTMDNAAGIGARQASVGTMTNAQVVTAITNYLATAGFPTANVAVTVTNVTHPAQDVSNATTLDKIQVSVSIPYSDVRWALSGFVVNANRTIVANATFYSAEANPYPSSFSMPNGW